MLYKNVNCYNIEKNFKYSTVISTFSEHITIFRTLSIDIWQLKCQQRQTNKTKNGKLFFQQTSELSKPLWNQKLLLLTATTRCSCYTLVRPFPTLSCFLKLIFVIKIKTMLLKQSAVWLTSCPKKYCVYYLCEHLKYCTQINEYWLNKNACLNII